MSRFGVVHAAFLALFLPAVVLHVGLPADPRTVGVTLRMSFRTR